MADNIKVTQEFVNKLLESNVWKTAKVLEPQKINESREVVSETNEVDTIPCPLCRSELTEGISDDSLLLFTDSVVGIVNENYSILDHKALSELNEGVLEECFCPVCNSVINEELTDETILGLADSIVSIVEQGHFGESPNGESPNGAPPNGADEDEDDDDADADDEDEDDDDADDEDEDEDDDDADDEDEDEDDDDADDDDDDAEDNANEG